MDIGNKGLPRKQNRYDYLSFYLKYFKNNLKSKGDGVKYVAFCPWHNDTSTPNLEINVISGRYKCWACGEYGGAWDIVNNSKKVNIEVDRPEKVTDPNKIKNIETQLNKLEQKKVVSELDKAMEGRQAASAHELLLRQPLMLKKLMDTRGYTLDTIKRWKIGVLGGKMCFAIPDRRGTTAALKIHKAYTTPNSRNQLFPWEAVLYNTIPYVIVVEGEPDMFLMRQIGFNALTQIHGANTWYSEFTKHFMRKITYLVYDNDSAGLNAMTYVACEFFEQSRLPVKLGRWPEFMGGEAEKGDHTDFFMKHGKGIEDYKQLVLAPAKYLSEYPNKCSHCAGFKKCTRKVLR